MSADFWTSLEVRGTKEECLEIMKVLCRYANDRKKQYREQHDCWYLDTNFGPLEEEVERRWNDGEMKLGISGPYGIWNPTPDGSDCDLFERLADASPDAWFRGKIKGWDTGGDVSIVAELIDGLLYYRSGYSSFDYDDDEFEEEDEDEEEEICEDEESYEAAEPDEEVWDGVYDPKTQEYRRISLASEGDSVTVSIVLTDSQDRQYELVLRSKDIEHPINLICFPKDLLAADDPGQLFRLLMDSVEVKDKEEFRNVQREMAVFGENMKAAIQKGELSKLELTKIHDHKAPFFFGWLRSPDYSPEMKKLAKRVKICKAEKRQKNLAVFRSYLESFEPYFPGCEWTGWPVFCGFGHSIPADGGGFVWNPETKTTLDWHGVAGSVEEFARYLCSKKEPREYAVEKVVIDYAAGTTEQTAVYMPGGLKIKTPPAE